MAELHHLALLGSYAIEQASRRWRGGRRDDSARPRRHILISTQAPGVGKDDEEASAAKLADYDGFMFGLPCPVPLTVRGTQALVSFAPLAFKLFYAARQNAVLRRSSFPSP